MDVVLVVAAGWLGALTASPFPPLVVAHESDDDDDDDRDDSLPGMVMTRADGVAVELM